MVKGFREKLENANASASQGKSSSKLNQSSMTKEGAGLIESATPAHYDHLSDTISVLFTVESTTPLGSPSAEATAITSATKPAAPVPDLSSTLANLQALANLQKAAPPVAHTPMNGVPPVEGNANVSFPQTAYAQALQPVAPFTSLQPAVQPVTTPTGVVLKVHGCT